MQEAVMIDDLSTFPCSCGKGWGQVGFKSKQMDMESLAEQYDEAMLEFSRGEYDEAIARLKAVLDAEPGHFDARLALGMAYYRKGDYTAAIAEGRKAEQSRPKDQLVHTNLSLFYMK